MVLMDIHFAWSGPFGEALTEALSELAQSINNEPGFQWKVWTEDRINSRAGGIYLFDTHENCEAYKTMHMARLSQMGINDFVVSIFDVNTPLSLINKATV